MPGDQEEALAALSEAAELAAVVCGFRDDVAVGLEQLDHLVEDGAAAGGDPRDVLPEPEVQRVVFPCLQGQPQPAERELIEGLILGRPGARFAQEPAEALARGTAEADVRTLAAGRLADVVGCGFAPAGGRLLFMERRVLFAAEEVEHRALHAGQAVEVRDRRLVDIDAADATERRVQMSDARAAAVEAARAASEAAEQMEVPNLDRSWSENHAVLSNGSPTSRQCGENQIRSRFAFWLEPSRRCAP